jgi:hypothetical protein
VTIGRQLHAIAGCQDPKPKSNMSTLFVAIGLNIDEPMPEPRNHRFGLYADHPLPLPIGGETHERLLSEQMPACCFQHEAADPDARAVPLRNAADMRTIRDQTTLDAPGNDRAVGFSDTEDRDTPTSSQARRVDIGRIDVLRQHRHAISADPVDASLDLADDHDVLGTLTRQENADHMTDLHGVRRYTLAIDENWRRHSEGNVDAIDDDAAEALDRSDDPCAANTVILVFSTAGHREARPADTVIASRLLRHGAGGNDKRQRDTRKKKQPP